MTDFEGLLPPRRDVPPLPDRGGPAGPTAVAAARRRRRTRAATAAGSAVAAFSVVLVAGAPADTTGVVVVPNVSPTPWVTNRPDALPAPTLSAASGSPWSGASSPKPSGTAAVTDPAGVPARPVPSGSASPVTVPVLPRYTAYDRDLAADRPDLPCAHAQSSPFTCGRTVVARNVYSGDPVDLEVEVCGRGGAIEVALARGEHAYVEVGPAGNPVFRTRMAPLAAETVEVAELRCLRWTFRWDGRTNDGVALPPGDYRVLGYVVTREPLDWVLMREEVMTVSER